MPGYMVDAPTAGTGGGSYLPYLMGIQALSGAFSSYNQAKASRYISRSNAVISRLRAQDALRQGGEAQARSRANIRQIVGSQKASFAAQGLRTTSGSPLDVMMETQDIGEMDALTIKNNAARVAYGLESDALQASLEGRLAYQSGINQSLDTLLTGGIKAYGYGRQFGF